MDNGGGNCRLRNLGSARMHARYLQGKPAAIEEVTGKLNPKFVRRADNRIFVTIKLGYPN
ncbi:MAG: hypothetical protein EAS52_15750 [Parapedobacter sp.]|nr:MAG: hypothetical protein EAS52_15750 [Parapedobacter sp.]